MQGYERVREPAPEIVTHEYLSQRQKAGWRLVMLEWERPVESAGTGKQIDVPYGWKVAGDCLHLEEDAGEQRTLLTMMELIVEDVPLSAVAETLNRKGFRTRTGQPWSPVAVFNLLPRLVELGPRILASDSWALRKQAVGG